MIRWHMQVSVLGIALAASPGGAFAQFDPGVPPGGNPRMQRAWREEAVAMVGPVARDFVETHGEEAVAAVFACSKAVAARLAQFHASGGLDRLPRPGDLLLTIARRECGDDVAVWAIGHAAELADRDSFDAYLLSPVEIALGLRKLEVGAAEVRAGRLKQAAMASKPAVQAPGPGRPATPSLVNAWEDMAPETKLCIAGGVFLIGVAAIVRWRRRRAAVA